MHQNPSRSTWAALVMVRRRFAAAGYSLHVQRSPVFSGPFRAVVYDPIGDPCGGVESHDLTLVVVALATFLDLRALPVRFNLFSTSN